MLVRRIILGAILALSLGAAGLVAQGCVVGYVSAGNNCDPKMPISCCQCPWPEDCPPWVSEPKLSIPDWCAPYLIDAGCPELYTYDRSFCEQNDAGTDGGDAADGDAGMSGFCSNGTCVPPAPEAWKHVAFALTWPGLPPACPEDAPNIAFEGSPAPSERTCPACSCDPPEGSCELPTTWTVSTEPCANPGAGVKTNFDAPTGWDGTCTNENAIAKDKLCGGVPCVRSITITPPIVEEKPCVSHTEGTADLPVLKAWSDSDRGPVGRACASDKPLSSCSGGGCGSTNSSFSACIMHDGDEVCPDGWIGDRYVLYGNIEDSRDCTPCGCDPPKGGTCQVLVKTFSDSSCSSANAAGFASTGMTPAPCHDYMGGDPVAGKTAEITSYTKGACAPTGGELIGGVSLGQQVTVCCQSSKM